MFKNVNQFENQIIKKIGIQSNLSTRVSHGELQKWLLLTGGLCSERQKLPIRFVRDKFRVAFIAGTHYSQVSLCTGLTVYPKVKDITHSFCKSKYTIGNYICIFNHVLLNLLCLLFICLPPTPNCTCYITDEDSQWANCQWNFTG